MILRRFFGGLVLPAMKPAPDGVRRLPLPPRLRVPLLQHAGAACEPCVAIGERVARWQRIGRVPDNTPGADVHAPAAGVVVAIEPGPVALPGTPQALHVVIDVDATERDAWARGTLAAEGDGKDEASTAFPPLDGRTAPVEALRRRIADAGVVGLGGVGVPSAEKLAAGCRLLILNGAECEPVVACDDALLRERAAEVIAGGRLLARLCGATRIVLAIKPHLAATLQAMLDAEANTGAHTRGDADARPGLGTPAPALALLPDRYPIGGERPLIHAITGEEVPDNGLPRDIGVLVHNVGTAFAAWRAVVRGEPLVSRLVTVGGDGIDATATFEVAIGTPLAALGEALGGWRDDAAVLRAGGPMMGVALPDDGVAIGKTTIAATVWRAPVARTALPCIRCGDCATVCPSRLQPQLIHARLQAGDAAGADALGLIACIECGACDAVCPSAIPLTAGFRVAREAAWRAAYRRWKADAARQRFERRIERLQREAEAAATSQAQRMKRVSGAAAAALAKARAKREGGATPTDATPPRDAGDNDRSAP